MGGAVEARFTLDSLALDTPPLSALTQDGIGGIINAGRIKRNWVDGPEYGTKFLSSTDILKADLNNCSYISNSAVAANPKLIIHHGWTLITRAGTVGRMAYTRPDMNGLACTEDVLRVIPNAQVILPGYLYAFMSSKFGLPLVLSGTYGAIIQHIEPAHIADLPVPRLGDEVEEKVHELIEEAATNRSEAAELREQSQALFIKEFSLPNLSNAGTPTSFDNFVVTSNNLTRLDAAFHCTAGTTAIKALSKCSETAVIGTIADIYQTNIFKRPYVDDPQYGYPYYSGSELFTYGPQPRGFLSKRAKGIDSYVVSKDWLLMQDAGQLGGLIGQVMRVGSHLNESVVSNHLIRIVPKTSEDSAFLFTILASPIGYRAVVRNAFGTSIPQLESKHIARIEIPWPNEGIRVKIASPVLRSWHLEDEAINMDLEAVKLVEQAIEEAA